MEFDAMQLPFDPHKLKSQVRLYKRLRQDNYYESAAIELKSIQMNLSKIKEANPASYDAFVKFIGL